MSFTSTCLNLIGRVPVAGACMRWLARQYREGSVVRIRSGKAAGLLWRRHHRYVSGYFLGHYEMSLQIELVRALGLGQTFYDVGGNAGFFTLLGAQTVGGNGRCVSFEPLPENVASIREQLDLNHFLTCEIFEGVVAAHPGLNRVTRGCDGDAQAHIASGPNDHTTISVPAITLDLASERYGAPDVVKMDIEGFEGDALRGATRLLEVAKTRWIIEVHSPRAWEDVRGQLESKHDIFDLSGLPVHRDVTFPLHVIAVPRIEKSTPTQENSSTAARP